MNGKSIKWVIDAACFDSVTDPPNSETTQKTKSKSGTLMKNIATGAEWDHTGETTVDTSQKGPVWSFT